MIEQLTVFLENKPGHLSKMCQVLGAAGINMDALTIAETTDYGLVRILTAAAGQARDILLQAGYQASVGPVLAVELEDKPGALAALVTALDAAQVNIEYCYVFPSRSGVALGVCKLAATGSAAASNGADAGRALEGVGFKLLTGPGLVNRPGRAYTP